MTRGRACQAEDGASAPKQEVLACLRSRKEAGIAARRLASVQGWHGVRVRKNGRAEFRKVDRHQIMWSLACFNSVRYVYLYPLLLLPLNTKEALLAPSCFLGSSQK